MIFGSTGFPPSVAMAVLCCSPFTSPTPPEPAVRAGGSAERRYKLAFINIVFI